MAEFNSWAEMSELEQARATFWDMYKDAHGIRPRHVDTSTWTLEQFHQTFDALEGIMKANDIARGIEEAVAVEKFERRITEMMTIGAKDRAMALRWMHEAEGSNGDDEYLGYLTGLPYQYLRKYESS